MSINKNELTKEQIAKAMSCETAEERVYGGDGRCGT